MKKIEEHDLRKAFEEVGSVNRINLKKKDDGFTFAFVSYDSVSEAEKAIHSLHRRKMGSKFINVKFAKGKDDGPPKRDNRDGGDEGRGFGGRGGPKKEYDSHRNKSREFDGGNRESRPPRDFNRDGDRKPMKCFKCHGEGHMSRNCPEDGGNSGRERHDRQDRQERHDRYEKKETQKKVEKMSESEFEDY